MAARLAIATLILLVAGQPTSAQTARLAGTVVTVLGTPIEGASVSLGAATGSGISFSDADGRFGIEGQAPGTYQLRVTRDGYRESVRQVVLGAGSSQNLTIELRRLFSETAVVTASREEQALITVPAAVTVIDSHRIETSAADTVADLLRGVPGLNITQLGARDFNVNARGASGILSNSMLVMVDGRSFFQPFYGAVYWDLMTVSLEEIGQIEILRTPASALWGANALNGVINVRTKSPRQMQGLSGYAGVGERGTRTGGLTWADATDRMSYKISGSYFEQEPWDRDDTLPDGSPMPPTALFQNRGTAQPKLDVRVDWDGNPGRTWSVRGGLAGANGLIHSALGPAEFGDRSYASYLELDHSSSNLDVKLYWNRLDAPFDIVLFGLGEDLTNDTYVAEATRRMRVADSHALTVGGFVRLDRFDITIAPDDRGRMDASAFIEDTVTLGPTVDVVLGGRLDKFDTTGAVFAPRVGLVVTPTPVHAVRVAYNRAYRAPTLLENFVDIALPTVASTDPPFFYFQRSLGSTDLEMERQDAVEIGYTGALNTHTTVFATVYHQVVENNIRFLPVSFYGPGAPPPGWPGDPNLVPPLAHVFSFANLGRVRDRGIELAAHLDWPRVSIQGSYTFQDTPDVQSGTPFPIEVNRPSRHQGALSLAYLADQWTASGQLQYTDRAFWADVFTQEFWGYTDSYVNVNARLSYRPPNTPWEVWLTATNLFDERIKSHVYGDTIGRKVTAGIRWEWDQ
jgi:outer membrane receptor protein involved in Fe transport